ncbi:MAG: hypothetical protein IT374_19915 [Polyangiaceae bacterium]|nr:hypothetical protein [Polyangiaceae bacterium]
MRWSLACLAVAAVGCDSPKSEAPSAPSAAPAVTSAPAAAPAPSASPPRLPNLVVDTPGVNVGGEPHHAQNPEATKRLRDAVAKLPVSGKDVPVVALRGAKTGDVTALLGALFAAGATGAEVRTQNRDRRDTLFSVTPPKRAGKLPECTVAAMMLKDRTAASWTLRGGVALKYPRGMAGPDLTLTFEGVAKQVKACAASTALVVSGDPSVEWGLTFDLYDKLKTTEPALPITTWIVPAEAPVAGRAVRLEQ